MSPPKGKPHDLNKELELLSLCAERVRADVSGTSWTKTPRSLAGRLRRAQAGIPIEDIRRIIDAWRAVLPIQVADADDLAAALEAFKAHRLPFWDVMLWASAQRAGVRCLLTEDLQDGFILQSVRFVNPFKRANDRLIDEVLPPEAARR